LRICIDIQAAIAQRAGVGRYTKELAEHIAPLATEDQLDLFYFDFKRKGIPFPVTGAGQRVVRWCPGRLAQKAWKTINWPPYEWFAGKADVYHFPNFVVPPLHAGRAVVTIHDVSFLRHPDTTEAKNLKYLNAKIRDTVRRADAIITDSRFSADEIEALLSVERSKLHPIHLGLNSDLAPTGDETIAAMRKQMGLTKPYLLTVGTLEPRKNIPFLVEVFEHLEDFDGELVIAGMQGWKFEPIMERMKQSSAANRIRYVSFVDDALLPALYSGAELFIFPSLYEGFGFPPLEAMACGTPVLSSTAGSLPEVLGDAAAYVDTFDAAIWHDTMSELLSDSDRMTVLTEAGRQRAAGFRWSETAHQTWQVYQAVAEGSTA
jgi:glycosyltransferase involved in cell wall biosynthesis